MNRRLLILGACTAAVFGTTAGPAFADGQSTGGSLVTVQVGSVGAEPSQSVDAPVNVNAPVCVLASCDGGSATQSSGGSTATTAGGNPSPERQSTHQSVGTVQAAAVNVAPATAANAPVNANAPICVLARCRHRTANQTSSGSAAHSSTHTGTTAGAQSVHHSVGTVQAGSVGADPATAVSAPVNANAPVCVAAACPGGGSGQAGGGSTATGSPASANDSSQTANGSLGTVQLGWFELAPRTGVSTPVDANAPVCLLASCPSAESGGRDGSPSGGPTTVTPAVVSAVIVPVPASTSVRRAAEPAATPPAKPKAGTPRTGVLGSAGSRHAHDPSLFPLGAVLVKGTLPYTGLALPGFLLAAITFLVAGGAVRVRTLV